MSKSRALLWHHRYYRYIRMMGRRYPDKKSKWIIVASYTIRGTSQSKKRGAK